MAFVYYYHAWRPLLRLRSSTIIPTDPLTILEPKDQHISEFYVVQECHATDFHAPKLCMGQSRYVIYQTLNSARVATEASEQRKIR